MIKVTAPTIPTTHRVTKVDLNAGTFDVYHGTMRYYPQGANPECEGLSIADLEILIERMKEAQAKL